MSPLLIVLIGVAVVIGGILALRLHAFLSLVAGALVIALLTPAATVYRFSLRTGEVDFARSTNDGAVELKSESTRPEGATLDLLTQTPAGLKQISTLRITGTLTKNTQQAAIISGDKNRPLSPTDIIVDPATEVSALATSRQTIGQRIAEGFGKTATDIGILIAMAAVLGQTLMESGAAERIVLSLRNAVGDSRASLAFLISGFVLAALVLSDTTFYLLIPLAQVMRVRSGRDYTLYILSIAAGAVMTHSLVPPAAGPVFVATELHVNLALMILGGAIVGAIAASAGYLYALWANRRWDIPLRGAVGVSKEELERISTRDESTLPPLWLALTPIVLPVILIAAGAVAGQSGQSNWIRMLNTLGEKNVALTLAAAIGLLMVWKQRDSLTTNATSPAVGQALASAGVMILIISAGGAFGYVARQTDIAAMAKDMLPTSKLALLPIAFLLTAAIRTAQGSAMVSMITATGIVAPIAVAGALGYHPLYLALAIGCGSKPFPWMNDAGFWIIGRMSGMTESETLKTVSVMMVIMGVVGLLATLMGAWLLPLAS
ncbi:MAG: GntP family permease [Planctomycetota bacterium]|nr:GntP family permease [Planctomycetota bacterium]